jgi:Uma2 family endonuclease
MGKEVHRHIYTDKLQSISLTFILQHGLIDFVEIHGHFYHSNLSNTMAPKQGSLTYTEYLALEQLSGQRLEFANGYTFAHPAADRLHDGIVLRLRAEIAMRLPEGGCTLGGASTRVVVTQAADATYYPDIVVLSAEQPVLLIEVLSPLTSSLDRREKLFSYQKIPTLREYVTIYTNEIYAERHHRSPVGTWDVQQLGVESQLVLESVPLAIALCQIYDGPP